ncbi:RING/U-box superfamily protein [Hirschfeldia incana]|nr:RING/U-box superfamily protein [Hirschfeldia incana]
MEKSHGSDMISKRQRLDPSLAGDITNPKGEDSSSKLVQFADDVVYKMYFKGLVSDVVVAESGERTVTAGFGVAICDVADNLLYEMKESLSDGDVKRRGVEIRALIHGLSEAFNMGIRHVRIHCDDYPIFQYINGGDKPTHNKMRQLVNEVCRLKEEMNSCEPLLVTRNDVKFAFKLAREALVSHSKAAQGETCAVCLEDTNADRMFLTDECNHRHCFSCVKQYVEVKLLRGIVPTCLGIGCKSELTLESCSEILTPRMTEMWKRKMREDSIPAAERIYCPYPNCEMLMSKSDLSGRANQSKVQECVICRGHFCIDCKVPSHTDMSCDDYKKLHPDSLVDDIKLKSLANDNCWRQCVKCRHLIELSQGCNHMTCRVEEEPKRMPFGLSAYWPCYDMSPLPPDAVQEYEDFHIEEGNDDEYDDPDNYGGLPEPDNDGGFYDFYMDYYSL